MAEETETKVRTRRFGRGRIIGAIVVLSIIALVASLRGIFTLYTDYLWYDDIGRTSVWTGILGAKIALSVVFVSLFFVLAWLNLVVADRVAPALRPPGPEEELIVRWHETIGRRTGLVRFIVAGFFALIAGAGAASQWNEWILFTNPISFETTDPVFDEDLSFYVFRLPFLSFVVGWLFAAFVIIGVVTAIWHYINGGIRIQTIDRRSTPQVKAHLSVILAILALLKAADYWLQRFELLGSNRGFRRGALYTDINASLPAIQLLLLISLFSVGLLVANIWRRGWVLPSIAVGLWALVAVVAGSVYPAAIQQFRVNPAEEQREALYIERNIASTRVALGLDQVVTGDYTYTGKIDAARLIEERAVFSTVRLLDPRIIDDSFTLNQQDRATYRDFAGKVDIDRYELDGELTPVAVGVRQLNRLSGQSWEKLHAVDTHGYGAVVAPANRFNDNGKPEFIVRDAPLRSDAEELTIDRPQIYFGDSDVAYGVVKTTSEEFDVIDGFEYDGDGGLPMGSTLRKLAFAFRFGEIEPLISGTLTDESEILFIRDVTERARRVAPFLHFDSNPYPVIAGGGISYVIDAYTTTDMFPYAERAPTGQLPNNADLRHNFNYVRNSVKAVVDAYDGSVELYVVDPTDPILRAYQRQFSDLFRSIDEMPDEIRQHLRFPEDLFRVQTEMWGRYHLDSVRDFYADNLSWQVASNPDSVSGGQQILSVDLSETGAARIIPERSRPVDPYYQVTRLPDEDETSFILSRSFVPVSDNENLRELTAYIAGRTDENGKNQIRQYLMSAGNNVDVRGPFQIDEALNVDPTISEESTELGRGGSQFLSGNLMVLLLDEAVVYVRPFYVRREPTDENPNAATEPLIKFVAVVVQENIGDETTEFEERIGFAPTYAGALAQVFNLSLEDAARLAGSEVPLDNDQSGVIDSTVGEGVQLRLQQILEKFDSAERALPDFAEYERLQSEALDDLEKLLEEVAASAAPDAIGEVEADPAAA